MKTYSCHRNHQRGSAVCPITIHQPIEEVEGMLLEHIREHVLNDEMIALVLDQIRAEIEAQMPQREADIGGARGRSAHRDHQAEAPREARGDVGRDLENLGRN